ncbi:translation initiation factor IF-2 [Candidatus Tachikawaea gelatinosa]|uniref:Translation initiation factor IF-2 n=1 Tax=Candidatus Tachikawaea gelatinosa TaxID=1410383 RepID=A0A090ASJ9_9ENTR|nr:translation initiation factor IF-2 [Candidatus Tachikawaea gelatinosa]BAP58860.1 translation initiation factor IF-2 [Candidatus Tachikawaea gelatinosa]
MIKTTIKSLAKEMQQSIEILIKYFSDLGIKKLKDDFITSKEKKKLFSYLNYEPCKLDLEKAILRRKTQKSTVNVLGSGGKTKSVRVEVIKKRTYLKEDKTVVEKKNILKQKINTVVENKLKKTEKEQIQKKNRHEKKRYPSKIEKIRLEIEAKKLKRKAEEETYRKLEENARRIAKEARIIAKEKPIDWNKDKSNSYEEIDYHLTTSKHARQAEDEIDQAIESGKGKSRNIKINKSKKNNKNFDSKKDREEIRAVNKIIRNNKNRKVLKSSALQQVFKKPIQIMNRNVVIGETINVADLANKMAIKSSQLIKAMMKSGIMITINQTLDKDTAQLIAEEMGHKVIIKKDNALEEAIMKDRDTIDIKEAEIRAPIVTIMGHVDHGKTSLLDYIRSTKIADKESGGITQHIGAYHVETSNGMITFLDTPGHSAFTNMRARGTQVTDIVVLVVSADDGVMPQTIEAIQHAKSANVPIIVAINKIDKKSADPERVKNELVKQNILPEEWGGDNIFVQVSAKTGKGVDDLLQAILLQAEIMELTAVKKGMAKGIVIESFLDKGKGPIATILVKEGTLKKGDIVLCNLEYGKIRAMRNELGIEIKKAGPSIPIEILGLSGVPLAGDEITVVRDEKKAKEVALYRQEKIRDLKLYRQPKSTSENLFLNIKKGEKSELNIVLKADVQGSLEAISESLMKLSNNEIKIKIVSSSVGGIRETDVNLAIASNAIIIGFNVRADYPARQIIEAESVDLRYYSVIYHLIDEIKSSMSGMLIPEYKQKIIGLAEVRSIFKSPKFNAIAGCMVTEGLVKRNHLLRVLRENIVIYEGELESLRRFKEDVNEVRSGTECGIGVKNYNDIRIGDIIEVFEMITIKRTIN